MCIDYSETLGSDVNFSLHDAKDSNVLIPIIFEACELIKKKEVCKKIKDCDFSEICKFVIKDKKYKIKRKKRILHDCKNNCDFEVVFFSIGTIKNDKNCYRIYLFADLKKDNFYVLLSKNRSEENWFLIQYHNYPKLHKYCSLTDEQLIDLEKLSEKLKESIFEYEFTIKYKYKKRKKPSENQPDKNIMPKSAEPTYLELVSVAEPLSVLLSCTNRPDSMLILWGIALLTRHAKKLSKTKWQFAVNITAENHDSASGLLETLGEIATWQEKELAYNSNECFESVIPYASGQETWQNILKEYRNEIVVLQCDHCNKTELSKICSDLKAHVKKLKAMLVIISKKQIASNLLFHIDLGTIAPLQITELKKHSDILGESVDAFYQVSEEQDYTDWIENELKVISKASHLPTVIQIKYAVLCAFLKQYFDFIYHSKALTEEQHEFYLNKIHSLYSAAPTKTMNNDNKIDQLSDRLAKCIYTIYDTCDNQLSREVSTDKPFIYSRCKNKDIGDLLCFIDEKMLGAFLNEHSNLIDTEIIHEFQNCDANELWKRCRAKEYLYTSEKGRHKYKIQNIHYLSFHLNQLKSDMGMTGTAGNTEKIPE